MPEKKKILVVEDDHLIRSCMVELLCMEGFDAAGAGDGTEAVTQAREQRPDLILCDILLPGVDGYGVLNQIRQSPETAGIRFAFLTARTQEHQIRSALAMGADGYLTKPFNVSSLLRLVNQMLEAGRV